MDSRDGFIGFPLAGISFGFTTFPTIVDLDRGLPQKGRCERAERTCNSGLCRGWQSRASGRFILFLQGSQNMHQN